MPMLPSAYRRWSRYLAWPGGLLPGLCHACGQWAWEALCPSCCNDSALHATLRCWGCALPTPQPLCIACREHAPPWALCVAAVTYASPWKELITAFKFQAQAGLADFLAHTMQSNPHIARLVSDCHHVIPVPLSAQRLRERGFNQALLLAKQLSPQHVLPTGLLRLRDTTAQSGLSRQERLHNLAHAFMVSPTHADVLRQSEVVLLDDVMTTGATLHACTQALLGAGVSRVDIVVLARTPA